MLQVSDKSLGGVLQMGWLKNSILQVSDKSLGGGGIVYCRWGGRKMACYRSMTKDWVVEE